MHEEFADLVAIVAIDEVEYDERRREIRRLPAGFQMAHNECDGVGHVFLSLADDLDSCNSRVVCALAPGVGRPPDNVVADAVKRLPSTKQTAEIDR